jgi:hypothetical protein
LLLELVTDRYPILWPDGPTVSFVCCTAACPVIGVWTPRQSLGIFSGLPIQSVQDNASNERTISLEFLKSSTYAAACNYVYSGIAINGEWQDSKQIRLQSGTVHHLKQKLYARQVARNSE